MKKEEFFSKIKNKCLDDEKVELTKKVNKIFAIEFGEELLHLYLKSDVILLDDVFEKIVKISIKDFIINHLHCVSVPGDTWQCGLKNTDIKLQTLQDKDLSSLLENNIIGGIRSFMGDTYVKLDENKKILYIDAKNLFVWAMSQMLPYVEIERWHGHPDLYTNKLDDILNTSDVSDIDYFIELE